MEAAEALTRYGAVASTRQLRRVLPRRKIKKALRAGEILQLSRGWFVLPTVGESRQAAVRVNGVVSHLSAALHWGMPVKLPPERAAVTVPRGRNLSPARRRGLEVHYANLARHAVLDGVTSPLRTVVDCARDLPFDAGLAVADSALRLRLVTQAQLLTAAEQSPRTGREKVRRVAREADLRAANPFESVLRAIALERGIQLEPQLRCFEFIQVDLGSNELRLAVEAESWTYHGDRRPFDDDVRRYTTLVRERWIVARFLWHDVMFRQDQVGDNLVSVAEWCAELRQFRRGAA